MQLWWAQDTECCCNLPQIGASAQNLHSKARSPWLRHSATCALVVWPLYVRNICREFVILNRKLSTCCWAHRNWTRSCLATEETMVSHSHKPATTRCGLAANHSSSEKHLPQIRQQKQLSWYPVLVCQVQRLFSKLQSGATACLYHVIFIAYGLALHHLLWGWVVQNSSRHVHRYTSEEGTHVDKKRHRRIGGNLRFRKSFKYAEHLMSAFVVRVGCASWDAGKRLARPHPAVL